MDNMPALRFAYSQSAVIGALLVCAVLSAGTPITLTVVCTVTLASACRLPLAFAALMGLVSWAYFTGFVANSYGELTFEPFDLVRLALLVAVGVAAHWSR
jgi:hypothetical protein